MPNLLNTCQGIKFICKPVERNRCCTGIPSTATGIPSTPLVLLAAAGSSREVLLLTFSTTLIPLTVAGTPVVMGGGGLKSIIMALATAIAESWKQYSASRH